jgi:hypothetical protein
MALSKAAGAFGVDGRLFAVLRDVEAFAFAVRVHEGASRADDLEKNQR